jgi:hypothetical protein
MAESINRAQLAAFRNYVEDHRDTILSKTLRGAPSLRHFTPYAGVKGKLILEQSTVADIVKRWAAAFEPLADRLIRKPVTVESHFHKAEAQFTPKEDLFTYKGHLVQTKQKPEDYPYAAWAMDKIAEMVKTQQEFDQIFTGDIDAGGTDAADILNGLLTLIADDLGGGSPVLTPVTTGVLASSTIVTQVEQMDDAIDEKFRTVDMAILAAPEIFKMYRRKYRELSGYHPGNPDTDAMDEIQLDGSTTKLISCPGMRGSQRLIMTPKSNIYYAYDDPTDESVFEMEPDHRNLDVWADYWFGVGFLMFDADILYVNDQA